MENGEIRRVKFIKCFTSHSTQSTEVEPLFFFHHPQVISIRFFYCLLPTNNKKKITKSWKLPSTTLDLFLCFPSAWRCIATIYRFGSGKKDMVINCILATASETHVLEACNKYTYLYEHHIHKQQETNPTTMNQIIGAHINVYNLCGKMFVEQT